MNNLTNNLSYYTVGDQIFKSKSLALIEATRVNKPAKWHFGDNVFPHLNWTTTPNTDILTVYQHRAKQLREQYEYLILCFSAGSDSTTVLESFLSQGLKVDEVLVKWPVKATEKIYTPNTNAIGENMLSEWDLSVKPALNKLASEHPEIKITVQDWSDDLDVELVEEDWFTINDHLNPGVFRKYSGRFTTPTEQKMIDQGKSSALIWGIEKPQLTLKDGNIYAYFLDKFVNFAFVSGTKNRIVELFFWNPDHPEVVVAQARLLYEYFIKNPQYLTMLDWNKRTAQHRTIYNNVVRGIIYPNWDSRIFQAAKPTSVIHPESDAWMFQHYSDHKYLQSWKHGLTSIKNSVDKKYHQYDANGRFDGWIGCISPFYKLGPVYNIDTNL